MVDRTCIRQQACTLLRAVRSYAYVRFLTHYYNYYRLAKPMELDPLLFLGCD